MVRVGATPLQPADMLLDTDVLIDLKRAAYPAAAAWLRGLAGFPYVSGVSAGEMLFGAQSRSELAEVQTFLEPFPIVWPSELDFEAAAGLARIKLSHGIGFLDAITAAVGVERGYTVVTFNTKHFQAIPGLSTHQPYTR